MKKINIETLSNRELIDYLIISISEVILELDVASPTTIVNIRKELLKRLKQQ